MKTIIRIDDDFDLQKIMNSGQCFRVKSFEDGMFRFLTADKILYIKKENDFEYCVSCSEDEWKLIWEPYFDMERSYSGIRKVVGNDNEFVATAMEHGCGLRILKQDTWEMLISFIISQRKSIPAISTAIEELSKRFGEAVKTEYETVYLFPEPFQIANAAEKELAACGLGYRLPYVRDAAEKVLSGEIDLSAIGQYDDEALFEALLNVRGVGKKVANCVCLFGYGRTGRAPIDVWIARAIDEEFGGIDPFPQYGDNAGIVQQYIFYYQKTRK